MTFEQLIRSLLAMDGITPKYNIKVEYHKSKKYAKMLKRQPATDLQSFLYYDANLFDFDGEIVINVDGELYEVFYKNGDFESGIRLRKI